MPLGRLELSPRTRLTSANNIKPTTHIFVLHHSSLQLRIKSRVKCLERRRKKIFQVQDLRVGEKDRYFFHMAIAAPQLTIWLR